MDACLFLSCFDESTGTEWRGSHQSTLLLCCHFFFSNSNWHRLRQDENQSEDVDPAELVKSWRVPRRSSDASQIGQRNSIRYDAKILVSASLCFRALQILFSLKITQLANRNMSDDVQSDRLMKPVPRKRERPHPSPSGCRSATPQTFEPNVLDK